MDNAHLLRGQLYIHIGGVLKAKDHVNNALLSYKQASKIILSHDAKRSGMLYYAEKFTISIYNKTNMKMPLYIKSKLIQLMRIDYEDKIWMLKSH